MDRNDLLATTKGLFLRAFSQGVDEWLHRCAVQLSDRAAQSSGEAQRVMLDAGKALRNADRALKQHLSGGMVRLIDRGFETAYNAFRPSFASAAKAPSLSLIDTGAVESELRLDWLATRFRNASEVALRDLNIRIAQLFSQQQIHERENPFRPYMFARCIVSAVDLLELPGDVTAALTEALGVTITDQVVEIYAQLNEALAQRGVDAELRLTIKKQAEPVPAASPGPAPASVAAATPAGATAGPASPDQAVAALLSGQEALSPGALLATQSRLESLLQQVLAAQGQATGSLPVAQAAGTVPVAGRAIQQTLQAVFSGEGVAAGSTLAFRNPAAQLEKLLDSLGAGAADLALPEDGSALPNLIMQHHAELSAVAGGDARQMVIDVVGLLFAYVLRDELLPRTVRVQLARMQFLVLRIGLIEPDLFTRKTHPLRLLINRIAEVALAVDNDMVRSTHVLAEVGRTLNPLLADRGDNPPLITVMLDRFEAWVRSLFSDDAVLAQRALQARHAATQRVAVHLAASDAIRQGMAGLRFMPYVESLLQEAWPRAIEKASRRDHQLAESWLHMVPELIWSIAPKSDAAERKLLLTLIPRLLPMLKAGLVQAGWNAAQLDEMQRWLVDAHKVALRSPEDPVQVPSLDMLRARFAPHFERVFAGGAGQAAIAPAVLQPFLDEALREHGVEVDFVAQAVADIRIGQVIAAASAQQAPLVERTAAVLERVACGVALALAVNGTPAHAILGWVSADKRMLLLHIAGARKPVLMSMETLVQLHEQGQARFAEPSPLFERAIASLLGAAEQAS
ncbi:hypothetical protein IGB42_01657 [Andreprevotia sp. IGB-42]|uniref:DUF1631 family protein n=1 Tax=Andreprevotia sp. IGB-42 TaxID=2497473 RepID=UPI0013596649|nr:DUF1631 family protein [Andreprevotia sp. IGB-42]KAF0813978.1 hypothetical protein IGB42_01657 [Andreprevotia sp. IGB-42]